MKATLHPFLLAFVGLMFASLACTVGQSVPPLPTQMTFPTPDMTMTALFAALASQVPATATPAAIAATETLPPPTATPLPPTPTHTAPPPTATYTPLPPTATPTVSYAGPDYRSSPAFDAIYFSRPPTINGDFSEWDGITRYDVNRVVYGDDQWDGANDLSGKAMFGWDEAYLYIAVRVADDRYVQDAGTASLFKGDSLDLLIDTSVGADHYLRALNWDDYQLGISAGNPNPGDSPEAYLWYPQSLAGKARGVLIGAVQTDDGYRVEAAIPWNVLGVTPKQGKHLGFAFSISDNDSNKTQQQSMVSLVPKRALTDPTTWGDLYLGMPEKPVGRDSINVRYVSSAPTIDANLGDWSNISEKPLPYVTYGKEHYDGEADLSGKVQLAWDNKNLYVAARITDNRYVQNVDGAKLYLGDSLEILFDRDFTGDFNSATLNNDDYQLGISPGSPDPNKNPEAYLWYPSGSAGRVNKVTIAAVAMEGGYILEAAIPWSILGVTPKEGATYGFVISASDNDNRENDVQQTMISSIATRKLTDPTSWGAITLVD